MNLTIAVDMDGTITDFVTPFTEKINDLFKLDIKVTKHINITELHSQLSKRHQELYINPHEIYHDVCCSGFFRDLKPYDGAIEAVNKLFDEGYKITFLTKALNWYRSAPEKAEWLHKHFPNKEYNVMMTDSTSSKHMVGVDIIVDDDPRVLDGVYLSHAICIAQPWNEKERANYSHVINSIKELPRTVDYLKETYYNWENDYEYLRAYW